MRSKLAIALLLGGTALLARADDDMMLPRTLNPAWQEECTSCHVGYPPALLTADNWSVLMNRLDRHFGADAQLDANTAAGITAWLKQHAATDARRHGADSLRITDTRWFVAEHDEVPATAWQGKAVGSAANCTACHRNAARGDYESARVPPTRR
jgi:hypothetical protein